MAPEIEKPAQQGQENFFAAARDLMRSVRDSVNAAVEPVIEPIMRDGTLAAAFRQGAEELWQALKPFPDMIEAREHETILSPTQGEIAADRKPEPPLSLGEIMKLNTPYQPEQDKGQDKGLEL